MVTFHGIPVNPSCTKIPLPRLASKSKPSVSAPDGRPAVFSMHFTHFTVPLGAETFSEPSKTFGCHGTKEVSVLDWNSWTVCLEWLITKSVRIEKSFPKSKLWSNSCKTSKCKVRVVHKTVTSASILPQDESILPDTLLTGAPTWGNNGLPNDWRGCDWQGWQGQQQHCPL